MKVSDLNFKEERCIESDVIYRADYENYHITVLDRMTGYGFGLRDTETGLCDRSLPKEENFWLASGMFDIRKYPEMAIGDAISFIKTNAYTVNPNRKDK